MSLASPGMAAQRSSARLAERRSTGRGRPKLHCTDRRLVEIEAVKAFSALECRQSIAYDTRSICIAKTPIAEMGSFVPGAPEAWIAVMGVTGAGKRTFIQTASGDPTVEIGHGLKSCTLAAFGSSSCLWEAY